MSALTGEVLVADGDESIRSLLEVVVRMLPERPILAADGRSAMELLSSRAFDAVVLDLMRSEIIGEVVLAWMSLSTPDLLPRCVIVDDRARAPLEAVPRPFLGLLPCFGSPFPSTTCNGPCASAVRARSVAGNLRETKWLLKHNGNVELASTFAVQRGRRTMDRMIGERIRGLRQAQGRSLADVAEKAKVSVATLSRIENDKQSVDLALFLTLAGILRVAPHDLLGEREDGDGVDPLARRIASLAARERVAFWRELAAERRSTRSKSRGAAVREVALHVEELLAQVEFLREELEMVRKRIKRR